MSRNWPGARKPVGGKKVPELQAPPSGAAALSNFIGDYFDNIKLKQTTDKKTEDPDSDSSWSRVSVSPPKEESSPYSGSDIFYPHESWVTYKHKARSLAVDHFGVQGKIEVRPIHGGSYNRVVSILINGQSRYILRIPRCPEKSDVEGEVAPLLFLRRHTPIVSPRVTAYDIRADNVINAPFMIQERLPGICLYPGWFDLTDSQKLRVAHDLGVVFRQILNTRSSKPGRLLFPGWSSWS